MSSPLPSSLDEARRRFRHIPRALRLVWASSRTWTAVWASLLLVRGLIPAATVYLTKWLVDAVAVAVGQGVSWEAAEPVIVYASLMAGLMLAQEVLGGVMTWIQTAQAETLHDHVKSRIHTKASEVDLAFYESPDYFDLMSRANAEASSRTLSLLQQIGSMVQNSITLVGVAALLLPYGHWVPFALLAGTLPALYVVLRHKRRFHDWWSETTEDRRWAEYFDRVLTYPQPAPELRQFELGPSFRAAYVQLRDMLRAGKIRLIGQQNLASVGAAAIGLVVTGAVMVWMGARALSGSATLGDLALFYRAFSEGRGLFRSLLSGLGNLFADTLFLEHLFSFLDLEPSVTDPAVPARTPLRDANPVVSTGIRFENIGFSYPGTETRALSGLTLDIPSGQTVAIVGPNGAGKSTITKLLCRFYDPQEGRVTIDGVDIRALPLDALRQLLTVMFQHPMQFIATAGDNIRMGDLRRAPDFFPGRNPSAHDAERRNGMMSATIDGSVREAAIASGAHSFLTDLPEGYETLLGKQFRGGAELSGGQWQRVTLARAFFREAPIVVLDEPTSFMDSWAEAEWLDRFIRLVDDRTAILVTHRFTTAMKADVIHVVDDGRVVESGSHAELLAAGGMYAASWHEQTRSASASDPATDMSPVEQEGGEPPSGRPSAFSPDVPRAPVRPG